MSHAKIDRSLLQNQRLMSVLKWGDHLQEIRSFLQMRDLASKVSCAKGHHTVRSPYYKFPIVQANTLQGMDYQQFVKEIKIYQAEKGIWANGVIEIETWQHLKEDLKLAFFRSPLREMKIREGYWNNTFGTVRNNETKSHQGWDIEAPEDTEIYAVSDGIVEKIDSLDKYDPNVAVEQRKDHFGKRILLKFYLPHIKKWRWAMYAHLSETSDEIKEKQIVTIGTILGKTGTSGNAIEETPHLHFEIRDKGGWFGGGLEHRIEPALFYGIKPLENLTWKP